MDSIYKIQKTDIFIINGARHHNIKSQKNHFMKEQITEVLSMTDLSTTGKLLYLYLLLNATEDRMIKMTNRKLSESVSLSEITINKNLDQLERLNRITRGFEFDRDAVGGIVRTIEILQ
jgi:hypothetical protein